MKATLMNKVCAAMLACCASGHAIAEAVVDFDDTYGDAPWTVQEDGSWRSGAITDGQNSCADVYVVGPVAVSFDWKVSSESYCDRLFVTMDADYPSEGTITTFESASISGYPDWERVSFLIADNEEHVLSWWYSKDWSVSSGEDCGWIRNLTVTEVDSVFTIALDANGGDCEKDEIYAAEGFEIGRLPKPYRGRNWEFLGWFTALEGGDEVGPDTMFTDEIVTLYAHWREIPSPENDDFANALTISGASGSVEGTTVCATPEVVDLIPDYAEYYATVWYKWTAPQDGRVTFSVAGTGDWSDESCYIGVTTGYSEGEGWSGSGVAWGQIAMDAVAGQTYWISLASYYDDEYNEDFDFELSWSPTPTNDEYESAQDLGNAEAGSVEGSLTGATIADNDAIWRYGDAERTVWYKWVAPFTGMVKFTATAGNGRDDLLYLLATRGYDEATETWADCDYYGENMVAFEVEEGKTYYLDLATWNYVVGEFTLAWEQIEFELRTWSEVDEDTGETNKWVHGYLGTAPEFLTFPEDTTAIGGSALSGADTIREVVVPGNVREVYNRAFAGCTGLVSAVFEEGVQYLGGTLFYGCQDGLEVTLPCSLFVVADENGEESFEPGFVFDSDYGTETFGGVDGTVRIFAPRGTEEYMYDSEIQYSEWVWYYDEELGYGSSNVVVTTTVAVDYYTRVFLDANGGTLDGENEAVYLSIGDAVDGLPVPVRPGHTFVNWVDEEGNVYENGAEWAAGMYEIHLTAQWTANQYTLTFDSNGGSEVAPITQDYGTEVVPPADPVFDGYVFQGWDKEIPSVMPDTDMTFVAIWGKIATAINFDAGEGAEGFVVPTNVVLVVGDALGEENYNSLTNAMEAASTPRHGRRLVGLVDGTNAVTAATIVTEGMNIAAYWETFNPLYEDDVDAIDASTAQVYDGYILDVAGDTVGSIQVKVGKPNKKTRRSSVSATVQMIGAKKLKFKAAEKGKVEINANGATENVKLVSAGSATPIFVDIAKDGLTGVYGDYEIIGARNVAKKSPASYADWVGTVNVAFGTKAVTGKGAAFAQGRSTVSVSIAAKGKVKLAGTMADGTKVTGSAQLLVADSGDEACVNVMIPLYSKKGGFGFVLWLAKDGTVTVESVSAWNATASKNPFSAELETLAADEAKLGNGSLVFSLSEVPVELAGAKVVPAATDGTTMLPDGMTVAVSGGKIVLPKAGKAKADKSGGIVVVGENAAGLKLSYTAKTGELKGSFSFYVQKGNKIKKVKATLTGVIVGGKGYGSAVVKKVGSFGFDLK